MEFHPTRIVLCKNCGSDVVINANYPISEVLRCAKCGLYGETEHTWRTWPNSDKK